MWLLIDNFLPWLFYNKTLVFYLGSKLSAVELSSSMLGIFDSFRLLEAETSLPKPSIQSVSFGQVFGESAVVGSHLALSGHNKHGQSMIVSIDAGSLFG